jgi:hypothetical protein
MSDRKYRQRGYQDDGRDKQSRGPQGPQKPPREPGAPAGARRISGTDGPKTLNMPGFREVVRCAQCGNVFTEEIVAETRCPRCGVDLRSCAQCTSFDPGSRFECMQAITARVSPKNTRNTCTFYAPRTTVERETTSPKASGDSSAKKAFDDLFKF